VAFAMLRGKAQRGWVFLYPVLTTAAVIATGNHYVLDVAAGVGLALATCTVFGVIRHTREVPEAVAVFQPAPVITGALEPSSLEP
jgi:membrane-associated phospholipid phosphatase